MILRTVLAALIFPTLASASPLWLGPGDVQSAALDHDQLAAIQKLVLDPRILTDVSDALRLGVVIEPADLEPSTTPKWLLRFERAVPSTNTLGEITSGDIDFLSGNESYCLTLGRYLARDVCTWPLDIALNGTVALHPSNEFQEDIFQFVLWVQFQWTRFPWDEHLRTKVGLGEGLSYVTHVPYSEVVRRDGRRSIHFLNYLEFSLSFNMQDLANLTRLNALLPGTEAEFLANTWLVGSIHHRSGGRGLFGDYTTANGDKKPMTGGDNLFVLGVQVEF